MTPVAADLVVPPAVREEGEAPDFESLMKAIRSDVQPDAWTEGGECSITPFLRNLSLVISATQGVHAEVGKLLAKLREDRGRIDPR